MEPISRLNLTYPIYALSLLPDNGLVVTGGGGLMKSGIPNSCDIILLDEETGALKPVASTELPDAGVAITSHRHTVHVIIDYGVKTFIARANSLRPASRFHHDVRVSSSVEQTAIAMSADGRVMVLAADDGSVCVLSLPRFSVLFRGALHSQGITDICVSADGKRICSTGRDRLAVVWDAHTGAILQTMRCITPAAGVPTTKGKCIPARRRGLVRALRLARGGELLFSAESAPHGGWVAVWQLQPTSTGEPYVPVCAMRVCKDALTGMTVDDAGRMVAITSSEGHISVLRFNSSTLTTVWTSENTLSALRGIEPPHILPVTGMRFAHSGQFLVTASADRSVAVWDTRPRTNWRSLIWIAGLLLALISCMCAAVWFRTQAAVRVDQERVLPGRVDLTPVDGVRHRRDGCGIVGAERGRDQRCKREMMRRQRDTARRWGNVCVVNNGKLLLERSGNCPVRGSRGGREDWWDVLGAFDDDRDIRSRDARAVPTSQEGQNVDLRLQQENTISGVRDRISANTADIVDTVHGVITTDNIIMDRVNPADSAKSVNVGNAAASVMIADSAESVNLADIASSGATSDSPLTTNNVESTPCDDTMDSVVTDDSAFGEVDEVVASPTGSPDAEELDMDDINSDDTVRDIDATEKDTLEQFDDVSADVQGTEVPGTVDTSMNSVELDLDDGGNFDEGNFDDGSFGGGNLDDGNPDDGNPDDGNPDDGNPDDGNPDDDGLGDGDGSLDDGSLDDGSLDEGSLDEGSLDEGSLDDGSLDDDNLNEGSFENASSREDFGDRPVQRDIEDLGNSVVSNEADVKHDGARNEASNLTATTEEEKSNSAWDYHINNDADEDVRKQSDDQTSQMKSHQVCLRRVRRLWEDSKTDKTGEERPNEDKSHREKGDVEERRKLARTLGKSGRWDRLNWLAKLFKNRKCNAINPRLTKSLQ